jgi:hypothetical protein
MSNLMIGFLLGIGIAAWVYNKMMHSTGNNTKNALTVAAVAGVFSMVLLAAILGGISR